MNLKLKDQIRACWMGKNIGGTLGAPFEGIKTKNNITFFEKIGDGTPLPNDDLDLQLVNLHAIEQHGIFLTAQEFSEEWKEHVFFPYDEYGFALMNMRRGICAPLSGYFNNPFSDCMGSPIRSELWGAVAAGRPNVAAYYATRDAFVDHAGGEGVYGEIFFSVLESKAYFSTDILNIVKESLKYIPEDCRTSRVVKDTINWYENGIAYEKVRELIIENHGRDNFTDAPQNIAFTIVGLLYGQDFEDVLLKTVNMGYDTDCTGATAGSIYGIMYGTAGIPKKWIEPVGNGIVVSSQVKGIDYPLDIDELTERTMKIHFAIEKEADERFSDMSTYLVDSQRFSLPLNKNSGSELEILFRGCDGPMAESGKEKLIDVSLYNHGISEWDIEIGQETSENKKYTSEVINLKPGENKKVTLTLCSCECSYQTVKYPLFIRRIVNNDIWNEYKIPFVLPRSAKWKIDGEDVFCENGTVVFKTIGEHTAETVLHIPFEKTMQLICASLYDYVIYVNNELFIASTNAPEYMPAFHRAPKSQRKIIDLIPGDYKILIKIKTTEENAPLMLLPVSSIKNPSASRYYLIECEIG